MFNTHGNKTSNGVVITEGMKVRDYNFDEGVVITDNDNDTYRCNEGYCRGDHWFDVALPGGGTSYMNGERLFAL